MVADHVRLWPGLLLLLALLVGADRRVVVEPVRLQPGLLPQLPGLHLLLALLAGADRRVVADHVRLWPGLWLPELTSFIGRRNQEGIGGLGIPALKSFNVYEAWAARR